MYLITRFFYINIIQQYLISRIFQKNARKLIRLRYVSIFDFASLVGNPIGIASSLVRCKVCVVIVNEGIKKCKFIIKKKRGSMIK